MGGTYSRHVDRKEYTQGFGGKAIKKETTRKTLVG
jgi:hypothetical protein